MYKPVNIQLREYLAHKKQLGHVDRAAQIEKECDAELRGVFSEAIQTIEAAIKGLNA